MTVNLPKYFIPEVVATFIYCFFTQSWQPEFGFLGPFMTGLSVYLIIVVNHTMAIVHFNPAVTVAFLVAKKIKTKDFWWYLLAQILGGLLGSAACYFLTYYSLETQLVATQSNNITNIQLSSDLNAAHIISTYALDVNPNNHNPLIILISETITTGVLCLLATLACYNPKTFKDVTAPICIGVSVFLGISAGIRVGAGCLNPIRSSMPWFCWYEKVLQNWTYNVGPMLGGIFSGVVYNFIYDEKLYVKEALFEEDENNNLKASC